MTILKVKEGSIAKELGIRAGDELLRINGESIHDELDFKFHSAGEDVTLETARGVELFAFEIEKEFDDDFGIVIEEMKMNACGNDCVFCFVDQNPEGLRKALYFRDGDYRFSHLFGNYNTMTNVGPQALERIVRQRLVPQYVSVHSTVFEVRKALMRLRKDDKILEKLQYLADNDIWMHTQVVLCPGLNDGEGLWKTVDDIYALGESVQTMAIVPVGLTSHRLGLIELRQIDREYAREMIEKVFALQKKFRAERGTNWLYLSDEWFLVAEMEVPQEEWYDGYPQLENGVGMVRDFIEETRREVESLKDENLLNEPKRLTLATAMLPSQFMASQLVPLLKEIPNLEVDLQVVTNRLYGPDVSVTGLLSGICFREHFIDKAPTDLLLLPPNVLNEDDVFLDDETPFGLRSKLDGRPIAIFHGSWREVLHYLLHPDAETFENHQIALPVIQ